MNAPCKDCERRTVHPNCHATCEQYKAYAEERNVIRSKYLEGRIYKDFLDDKIERLRKKKHWRSNV